VLQGTGEETGAVVGGCAAVDFGSDPGLRAETQILVFSSSHWRISGLNGAIRNTSAILAPFFPQKAGESSIDGRAASSVEPRKDDAPSPHSRMMEPGNRRVQARPAISSRGVCIGY
jgi:hypothetical protein